MYIDQPVVVSFLHPTSNPSNNNAFEHGLLKLSGKYKNSERCSVEELYIWKERTPDRKEFRAKWACMTSQACKQAGTHVKSRGFVRTLPSVLLSGGGGVLDPSFGCRETPVGLEPWPCLGQKKPLKHIPYACRTPPILDPCLGQRTGWNLEILTTINFLLWKLSDVA